MVTSIVKAFLAVGLPLSDIQASQFEAYRKMLVLWNQKTSLISRADENRIVDRHFIESSALAMCEELPNHAALLDLGTGAGFPGVPLKILRPDLVVTLLDSRRIKTIFLRTLLPSLGLHDVRVVCARAEELAREESACRGYDVVVSRAVANVTQLYRWALPLMKEDGVLISLRGSRSEVEIKEFLESFPRAHVNRTTLAGRVTKASENLEVVRIKSREHNGP